MTARLQTRHYVLVEVGDAWTVVDRETGELTDIDGRAARDFWRELVRLESRTDGMAEGVLFDELIREHTEPGITPKEVA